MEGFNLLFFSLSKISHSRIAELEEDNKMSPSNLGIVFGPSLMRPRPTGATISLSSLVDYPHQARIVEAMIVFYSSIFQSKTSQSHKSNRSTSSSTQQVGSPLAVLLVNYEILIDLGVNFIFQELHFIKLWFYTSTEPLSVVVIPLVLITSVSKREDDEGYYYHFM